MRDESSWIEEFFSSPPFAVVGASNNPDKYGYKVLACYVELGQEAYPVNPREEKVQGLCCYATLLDLPVPASSVSIITPPPVTERIAAEAAAAGAKILWMQPGAESAAAVQIAESFGLGVIHGGPCLLVELPRFSRERA